jgi:CHAD domain-containing protein
LQAELDIDLAELPRASHEAQAILEFSKQGEKLRKVLGPVRELDVWIGKLQGLLASLARPGDYVPCSTRECMNQIVQFELRLKEKRRRLEKKLIAAIEKRKGSFAAAGDIVIDGGPKGDANAARMISAQFAEVVKGFPVLNEENLHEFRKRIKMVRYLAETHHGDTACIQFAAQLKKLQSAIGVWHDWQAIAREVRRGRSKGKDAAELLEAIAAESLEAALTTCRTITDKLLADGTLASAAASVRKPPQPGDHGPSGEADRKLA